MPQNRVLGSGVELAEDALRAKEVGHRGSWLTLSCDDLANTKGTTVARPTIALTGLLEKRVDADLLKKMTVML